jgi:thiamine-phosphate pyrophosphorylase
LNDALRQSAQAGVKIVQYRNKSASMKEAYAEALPLRKLAAELGVFFIVNDRCDLALAVDADGVHLGQGDLPLELARKVMGPDKLIGISTHNPDQVRAASAGKPDYLGFGPIFKPGSKQDHDPVVGIEGLRAIRPLTSLPIFAIGGITVDNVGEVSPGYQPGGQRLPRADACTSLVSFFTSLFAASFPTAQSNRANRASTPAI